MLYGMFVTISRQPRRPAQAQVSLWIVFLNATWAQICGEGEMGLSYRFKDQMNYLVPSTPNWQTGVLWTSAPVGGLVPPGTWQ